MALEVAERAVVGDDLEAVAQRLEAAARAVAAVRRARRRGRRASARARSSSSACTARSVRSSGTPAASNSSAASSRSSSPSTCISRDRDALVRVLVAVQPEPRRPAPLGRPALAQVVDPDVAAAGALDARDEARDHGLDRLEHPLAAAPRLRQRVREQVQDQLLVGLAGRVDAHVRQRRGGQQPAQQVQRLGLDRAAADRLGLAGRGRERRVHPRAHARQRLRVRVEQRVHRRRRTRARAPRRGSSGSRRRASARRRRCSAWTARGSPPAAGAAAPSSARSRPTRTRCARRRAGPPSRRRSRRRCARRAPPRARPRRPCPPARRSRQRVRELVQEQPPQRARDSASSGRTSRALTVSGRPTSANTGPSTFEKCGRQTGALGWREVLHGFDLSDGLGRIGPMGIPVTGVSELVLEVVDLEAAEAFYAGVLGPAGRRPLARPRSDLGDGRRPHADRPLAPAGRPAGQPRRRPRPLRAAHRRGRLRRRGRDAASRPASTSASTSSRPARTRARPTSTTPTTTSSSSGPGTSPATSAARLAQSKRSRSGAARPRASPRRAACAPRSAGRRRRTSTPPLTLPSADESSSIVETVRSTVPCVPIRRSTASTRRRCPAATAAGFEQRLRDRAVLRVAQVEPHHASRSSGRRGRRRRCAGTRSRAARRGRTCTRRATPRGRARPATAGTATTPRRRARARP